MSVSDEFEEYVIEQLSVAGEVRSRRMFGGVGFYLDEMFCAIIGKDSGSLFFKVDESNRADYEREGMEPFRIGEGTMSYFEVPEHVLEDPELLGDWALKARAVAVSSSNR